MAKQQDKPSFKERFKQIGTAFKFTTKRDKAFLPLVITAILTPILLVLALVLLVGLSWLWMASSVFMSLLSMMIVLNLRTSKAVMNEAVGKPGAAFAIMENVRGWNLTPGVAVSAQQDMVHRAIGKPGVVLLAEGGSGRMRSLVNQEKKKLSRVVGTTPIYDFVIGEEEGQLSIRKLRKTLAKLPRNINAKQANDLNRRLNALKQTKSAPMPKGPVPQNSRPPKGARKAMRGR